MDSIKDKIKYETGTEIGYSLKWTTQEFSREKDDIQAYWEDKLHYMRMGNRWFKKGITEGYKETDAWFEKADIGQYPTKCSDGTPAPSGLHLKFNLSEDSVGTGTGIMVGWSFLGDQIQDYLNACNVKDTKELIEPTLQQRALNEAIEKCVNTSVGGILKDIIAIFEKQMSTRRWTFSISMTI